MDNYELAKTFQDCDKNAQLFVDACLEDIAFDMELWGADDGALSRIENKSRDGFWAFTEGGWRAMPFGDIGSAQGSGCHDGMLSDEIERMQLDAMQGYIWDNDLSDDAFELSGGDAYEIIAGSLGEDMEPFYEYEHEYMSSNFYIDIRATYYGADNSYNRSGADEVVLSVWLNLDEYGRECAGSCVWSKLVSAKALARASEDAIKSIAIDASGGAQSFLEVQCE